MALGIRSGHHADAIIVDWICSHPAGQNQAGDQFVTFDEQRARLHKALMLQHFSSSFRTFVEKLSFIFYDECTLNFFAKLESCGAITQAALKVLRRHIQAFKTIKVNGVVGIIDLYFAGCFPVAGVDQVYISQILVISICLGPFTGEVLFDFGSFTQRI